MFLMVGPVSFVLFCHIFSSYFYHSQQATPAEAAENHIRAEQKLLQPEA